MTRKKLLLAALVKFFSGLLMVELLLFLPAGTFCYWNAWLFIGALFIPMLFLGVYLFAKEPKLLEKRLQSNEQETTQKWVIFVSLLMFIGGFLLAGFDFRYQWLPIPAWMALVATVIMWLGYALVIKVMQENAYLSRTVEVQENQKVISTGLYGIVRHPMYLGTLLLFMSMPLVLGSFYAFLLFLLYPMVLVVRIRNEEVVLEKGLDGYREYKQKVKYKLIPFIW